MRIRLESVSVTDIGAALAFYAEVRRHGRTIRRTGVERTDDVALGVAERESATARRTIALSSGE